MAFKKTLAQRLFNVTRISSNTPTSCLCRISSSSVPARTSKNSTIAPDPGDERISRRFLHKRSIIPTPAIISSPFASNLVEKIREIGVSKDRIKLDKMLPLPVEESRETAGAPTVEEVRKVMVAAAMEMVKKKLREMGKSWITYKEFIRICGEACPNPEQGIRIAKMLDDSGNVIILREFVCLSPDQVIKTMKGLIPSFECTKDHKERKELEKLETLKAEIDTKANDLVRRELWAGLGYLVVQTLGFMRLTFWELSWDVMEPICFYVTSSYFLAGYAFFLTTSKEPSFEGFYQSRFEAKQKRLIEMHNFDIKRYNELRKIFCPKLSGRSLSKYS